MPRPKEHYLKLKAQDEVPLAEVRRTKASCGALVILPSLLSSRARDGGQHPGVDDDAVVLGPEAWQNEGDVLIAGKAES